MPFLEYSEGAFFMKIELNQNKKPPQKRKGA